MRNIVTTIMVLFIGINFVSAQAKGDMKRQGNLKTEFRESLSDDQKNLLEEKRKLVKTHRESFEATFTANQLSMLETAKADRSKRRRYKTLKPTFNDGQKEMRKTQKEELKMVNDRFIASLSEEQMNNYDAIKKHKKEKRRDNTKQKH